MRTLPIVFLLAACSQEPERPAVQERALYAGEGHDRLCVSGERAGFVIYGAAETNCSAKGRLERAGTTATLTPDGDEDCHIALDFSGGRVAFGPATSSCAYYCGPGAAYDGKALARNDAASPAVDFAGDPLC